MIELWFYTEVEQVEPLFKAYTYDPVIVFIDNLPDTGPSSRTMKGAILKQPFGQTEPKWHHNEIFSKYDLWTTEEALRKIDARQIADEEDYFKRMSLVSRNRKRVINWCQKN